MTNEKIESSNHLESHKVQRITFIFLAMIIVSFSLSMSVGNLCFRQEGFLIALFSIGCGGLYGMHVDQLDFELLSKYKFGGAAGISIVLIFAMFPEKDRVSDCQSIFSGSTKFSLITQAYAQDTESTDSEIIENQLPIRVIYPIGVGDLKDKAINIERQISTTTPSLQTSLWSRGGLRSAVVNQFKDFDNNDVQVLIYGLSNADDETLSAIERIGELSGSIGDPIIKNDDAISGAAYISIEIGLSE